MFKGYGKQSNYVAKAFLQRPKKKFLVPLLSKSDFSIYKLSPS